MKIRLRLATYKDLRDHLDGWEDRVLVLWEEDDAKPEGRETPSEAHQRLSGKSWIRGTNIFKPKVLATHDGGDTSYTLFEDGFVEINYFGAYGGIGVVTVVSVENTFGNFELTDKVCSLCKIQLVEFRHGALRYWEHATPPDFDDHAADPVDKTP